MKITFTNVPHKLRGYILERTAELVEQLNFNCNKVEITIEIKGGC